MSAYESLFHPGRTWFFTLNLADENSTLLTEHAGLLAESSREVEALYPFDTIAAVILPDHMHLIWTLPNDDMDSARRVANLQAGFTQRILAGGHMPRKKRNYALWHQRYWDYKIRDLVDLERHIGYIHGNPVKHNLASHPDMWRHSTWHRFRKDGFVLWTVKPLGSAGES